MEKICVVGGKPLKGSVRIQNAKNAVLPMLGAVLLSREESEIPDCPHLADVHNMCGILTHLGCQCRWEGDSLFVSSRHADKYEMPEALAREMRSSIFLLGPVLARFGRAVCAYPGGCEIGSRPIDLHLKGLRALNVKITEERGRIFCDGRNMRGAVIQLDYPSVGATENLMMAAVAAKGETVIHNAAREPEIIALANALNRMGAEVTGAGSSTVVIPCCKGLRGCRYEPLPDRIAAGTFLTAAAMTAGDVTVERVEPEHLRSVLAKLSECGCDIITNKNSIRCIGPRRPKEIRLVETLPYPGFPTDMQAALLTLCTVAEGTSVVVENVFENRFRIVPELTCMGASITVKDRMAIVRGVRELNGAEVNACDLRAGAALVLAGLCARDATTVRNVGVIDRGYEKLERTLALLGADIARVSVQT